MRLLYPLLALTCLQFLTLKTGVEWQRWTAEKHPSAVLIPIPLIFSVIGCAALDRFGLRSGRSSRIRESGYSVFRLATLTALTMLLVYLTYATSTGLRIAAGRSVLVFTWGYLTSLLSLQIVLSFDHNQLTNLMRNKWTQRSIAGIVGLGICGITVATLELVCGLMLSFRTPPPQKLYEGNYLEPEAFYRHDADLGTALQPNRTVSCRLKVDNQVVWDVRYSTDEYGRRSTVVKESSEPQNLAIFFGCSYMFGEGANDDQTIPSEFVNLRRDYRAINCGVLGWGTQHMLALLESGMLPQQIPEVKTVVGIYLYVSEVHESRVIGEMDVVNGFGSDFPYYFTTDGGSVRRSGTFSTHRESINLIYRVLGQSNIRKLAGLNFPRRRLSHYDLTTAIISRSRELFTKQFPGSQFWLAPYPSIGEESRSVRHSRVRGVQVLPTQRIFDPSDIKYYHAGDGHPTPMANKLLAEAIAESLGLPK